MVELSLDLAQDGVVDLVLVAQADEGGASAGKQGQARFGLRLPGRGSPGA
jgi:hypothetical protein